ncbi:MAG: DNA-directed RNA polymerase subunit omega [Bacilli bacterium]|nr:DNA-directed RNA polymerase subunit omega [Bacilli bacterium]
MRYPSIDKLLDIVPSKYKLVIISAKRAKQIDQGDPVRVENPKCVKSVGQALEEIVEGKLNIKF